MVQVFCRRWGVPLIDGGTFRLPHLIGLSRAMDMILTGRPVGAAEAREFGLANRVVPIGKAVEQSIELARSIAQFPQQCMRADRMSAYGAFNHTNMRSALKVELSRGALVLPDASKGAQRYSQQREQKKNQIAKL